MSSKSKAKGTAGEREVVRYLQQWWPAAERRALSGNKDRGDIAGIPGLVVEVKAAKVQSLTAWYRETEAERVNAGATYCMLVVKRPYKPVAQWDAYLPSRDIAIWLADTYGGGQEWSRMDLALAVAIHRWIADH